MFTETLFGNTEKALAVLGKSGILADAYLAGGTACALQVGHRISIDLDFFTPQKITPKEIALELKKLGEYEQPRGKTAGLFIRIVKTSP